MIRVDSAAPEWAHRLAQSIEERLDDAPAAPIALPTYQSGALPSAGRHRGSVVFVIGANRPAYSDGAVWRWIVDDGAV